MHEFWLILVINRSSVRGRRGISKSMDMREGEVILRGSGRCKICCLSWSSKSPWLKNGMARLLVTLNEAFVGSLPRYHLLSPLTKVFGFQKEFVITEAQKNLIWQKRGEKRDNPTAKRRGGGWKEDEKEKLARSSPNTECTK